PPDVAPRHVEIRPGGDPTADDARDDCRQIRHMVNYLQHRSAHRSEAKGCSVTAATQVSTDGAWLTMAFRFAGGSSFARSSASAASRAATSRSPFLAWNSSFVISSAARIAALCVSTIGPWARTLFSAWSTWPAPSRVYSGRSSDP